MMLQANKILENCTQTKQRNSKEWLIQANAIIRKNPRAIAKENRVALIGISMSFETSLAFGDFHGTS